MAIQFGALDDQKNKYIYYLTVAVIWMWIYYVLERLKAKFFGVFNKSDLLSTFVFLVGVVFIVLSSYSTVLAYNITSSVRKLQLPPVNSFQSFYQYFVDLANNGAIEEANAYSNTTEGFRDVSSNKIDIPVINTTDICNNVLEEKIHDDSQFQEINADELVNKDTTIKMMDRLGLQSNYEFTTTGLTKSDFCSKQTVNSTGSQKISETFDTFLLSKHNKDLYYITNNTKYYIPGRIQALTALYNNQELGNILMILSYNSGYKENTQNAYNLIRTDKDYNGIFLLDYANNVYNIHNMGPPTSRVSLTIYPNLNSYQITNMTTPIGANGVGTYLLAPNNADLFFIKTQYTATKSVEIYGLDINSRYSKFVVNTGTPLLFDGVNSCTWKAKLDPNNIVDKKYMDQLMIEDYSFNLVGGVGTYLMNRKRDLYFIKTVDTDSKMIEIHGLSAASNYQQFCIHQVTALRILYVSDKSTLPIGNKWASFGVGTFELDRDDNLVYIKPTSRDENDLISSMSIFTLSAGRNYKKFIK
jgi:hypothetical protein